MMKGVIHDDKKNLRKMKMRFLSKEVFYNLNKFKNYF